MSVNVRVIEKYNLMEIEVGDEPLLLDRDEAIELRQQIADFIGEMGVEMKRGKA